MLTLLFSLIADMSENPDGFRTDTKTALRELADGREWRLKLRRRLATLQSKSSLMFFKIRNR
jgi:hypothetical protein